MAGRVPKPTAIKKLEGNRGKRKLNPQEPQPDPPAEMTYADPPVFLNSHGRKYWEQMLPRLVALGIVSELDLAGFAALCDMWGRYVKLSLALNSEAINEIVQTAEKLNDKGEVVGGGNIIMNPATAAMNKAWDNFRKMAAEFGMLPGSRSKITGSTSGEVDPMGAYLAGRRRN